MVLMRFLILLVNCIKLTSNFYTSQSSGKELFASRCSCQRRERKFCASLQGTRHGPAFVEHVFSYMCTGPCRNIRLYFPREQYALSCIEVIQEICLLVVVRNGIFFRDSSCLGPNAESFATAFQQ
jgi:hypothetical protein